VKETGQELGGSVTVIDRQRKSDFIARGMNQTIAFKSDGIATFADATSLQGPIKSSVFHGAGLCHRQLTV
jgi:hypothetical protein